MTHLINNFSMTQSQTTIKSPVILSGVGLHSGIETTVKILPADVNSGRYFVRVDLHDQPIIKADVNQVITTTLSTELANGEAKVRTVEHLLASLTGLGIDNARIEIDGPEIPLLDGSAKVWFDAIKSVGILAQEKPCNSPYVLSEPITINQGDVFISAIPSPEIRFTYGIDFELQAIANQWHSFSLSQDFSTEIAPARTFGLAHQVEQLRSAGLIKGGSLENALVCSAEGWLNPPLRFENEPARHKLLDLIGDLSLLGTLPQAHFIAYKASHNLHIALARILHDKMSSYVK
jgi:UDP-3-O-[3-hydroxymyristoyl] N-acetylglucosamine deacetylase